MSASVSSRPALTKPSASLAIFTASSSLHFSSTSIFMRVDGHLGGRGPVGARRRSNFFFSAGAVAATLASSSASTLTRLASSGICLTAIVPSSSPSGRPCSRRRRLSTSLASRSLSSAAIDFACVCAFSVLDRLLGLVALDLVGRVIGRELVHRAGGARASKKNWFEIASAVLKSPFLTPRRGGTCLRRLASCGSIDRLGLRRPCRRQLGHRGQRLDRPDLLMLEDVGGSARNFLARAASALALASAGRSPMRRPRARACRSSRRAVSAASSLIRLALSGAIVSASMSVSAATRGVEIGELGLQRRCRRRHDRRHCRRCAAIDRWCRRAGTVERGADRTSVDRWWRCVDRGAPVRRDSFRPPQAEDLEKLCHSRSPAALQPLLSCLAHSGRLRRSLWRIELRSARMLPRWLQRTSVLLMQIVHARHLVAAERAHAGVVGVVHEFRDRVDAGLAPPKLRSPNASRPSRTCGEQVQGLAILRSTASLVTTCFFADSAPPRLPSATPRPSASRPSSAPPGSRGSTPARTRSPGSSCSATTASSRATSRSTRSTRSSDRPRHARPALSRPRAGAGVRGRRRRRSPRPGSRPEDIDAIVVSTCTGYLCPGLSGYVVERLGLRADVQAYDLVGQGCAAALPNLQLGRSLLAAGTRASTCSRSASRSAAPRCTSTTIPAC